MTVKIESFKAESIRAKYRRAGLKRVTPGSEIRKVMARHNLSVAEMAAYLNITSHQLVKMAESRQLSPISSVALFFIDNSLSDHD